MNHLYLKLLGLFYILLFEGNGSVVSCDSFLFNGLSTYE